MQVKNHVVNISLYEKYDEEFEIVDAVEIGIKNSSDLELEKTKPFFEIDKKEDYVQFNIANCCRIPQVELIFQKKIENIGLVKKKEFRKLKKSRERKRKREDDDDINQREFGDR